MITMQYNGVYFYHPNAANSTDNLYLITANLQTAVNTAGLLTFSAPPVNTQAATISELSGIIEVKDGNRTIFRGRAVKSKPDWYNNTNIEAEGLLACLNDSIVPPYSWPEDFEDDPDYQDAYQHGNVVQFYLGWLLDRHNAAVSSAQQILLGTVTVTDPNNYITRSNESYSTTWETILNKFAKSNLGGYLLVRYEPGGTYLDYVDSFSLTNSQEIEFAENLIGLDREIDASKIYTDIIPIGADGLTISTLPDGPITADVVKAGNTIYSLSGRAAYGIITRVVEFNDITLPVNLQSRAVSTLTNVGLYLPLSMTIKAADISFVTPGETSYQVGRNTIVHTTPHGLCGTYPLTQENRNLLNPAQTQITLGETVRAGLANNLQNAITTINVVADDQQRQINANADGLNGLAQSTIDQFTAFTQTTQEIILSALEDYVTTNDFSTYQQTVSSQLEVLADQVRISVNALTDQIDNVDGDMQRQFAEYGRVFRFTLNGFVIGVPGAEIEANFDADRISFLENGNEVAYISNRKLYITDGEFLGYLQLGNYKWIPRQNGNLSMIKVG